MGDSPLVILVDVGNYGTVDETMRLEVTFYAYSLASGVYVYGLQAVDFIQSRKLALLR